MKPGMARLVEKCTFLHCFRTFNRFNFYITRRAVKKSLTFGREKALFLKISGAFERK